MKISKKTPSKTGEGVVNIQLANSEELAAISRTVHRYKTDQEVLRRAMEKAGITTKSGQLSREYQSK